MPEEQRVNAVVLLEEMLSDRVGCSHNANVTIHCSDSLISPGLQELAGDDFLDCQHHAILASNADRRASVLDSLHGILHLESCVSRDGVLKADRCRAPKESICTWKFRPSGEKTELERS